MSSCGYISNQKENKRTYIILKLLTTEGFSIDEMCETYCITKKYVRRLIQSVRDALYDVFDEDIQLIYDRTRKRYYLLILKSGFNLINLPLF